MPAPAPSEPSPAAFFSTINAYQHTAALRAGIELGIFDAIGGGALSPGDIAAKVGAAQRGVRILCDALTVLGFVVKDGGTYRNTPDSAAFLVRNSPAYVGGAVGFLLSPTLRGMFDRLADAVRKGGTAVEQGTVEPEHPVWVEFARAMAPLMGLPAQLMADVLTRGAPRPLKVLDVAGGHGMFGITVAQRNPETHVTVLDWPNVIEVARENARAAGLEGRYHSLPGSAFDVDWGSGYDVVLLTNFLHHFDPPACERLLIKAHAALAPGGRTATLEFVPHDDRVSPPPAAMFALIMLASTPSGDAYTLAELEAMHRNAGFARVEDHALPPSTQTLVVGNK